MIHPKLFAGLVAGMLIVVCCGGDRRASDDGIQIVVTTTVLGDIVESIARDDASVEILMPLGADPHDFQASARQVAAIHKADLVVANGLGLEEGLEPVLSSAVDDGARVLSIGPLVNPIPYGNDPDLPDPHVWLDPIRMMTAVDVIVSELESLEPSVDWSDSGDDYKSELAILDWELQALLGKIPISSRGLVTDHDSLEYFADRYGFRVVGVVIPGGSTLAQPSSDDLVAVVETIERELVTAIFIEAAQPAVMARAIGEEVSWDVEIVELYIGSLGRPGSEAETYLGMLRVNSDRIASALGS